MRAWRSQMFYSLGTDVCYQNKCTHPRRVREPIRACGCCCGGCAGGSGRRGADQGFYTCMNPCCMLRWVRQPARPSGGGRGGCAGGSGGCGARREGGQGAAGLGRRPLQPRLQEGLPVPAGAAAAAARKHLSSLALNVCCHAPLCECYRTVVLHAMAESLSFRKYHS